MFLNIPAGVGRLPGLLYRVECRLRRWIVMAIMAGVGIAVKIGEWIAPPETEL